MQTITIQSDADFTPKGKRVVRIVKTAKSGKKMPATLAWYVGGKLYRYLELNAKNTVLSVKWGLC